MQLHTKQRDKTKQQLFAMLVFALLTGHLGIPNLRLVGLHKDNANKSIAIIENQDTKSQDVFSEAMSVFGNATLTQINSDSVILKDATQIFTLKARKVTNKTESFSNETNDYLNAIALTADSKDAIVTKISKVDENLPLIHFSQKYINQNSGLSLTEAISLTKPILDTATNYTGVRLSSVDKTNPLAMLGLQTGDILILLNGRSIDSIEKLYEIAKIDPGERTPEISLIRNGKTIDLLFQLD